jgi:hypothetical protein
MTEAKNFKHIKDNYYLVRTQAGLKQAIKHAGFAAGNYNEVINYPISYPSIVCLNPRYTGGIDLDCNAIHINYFKDIE